MKIEDLSLRERLKVYYNRCDPNEPLEPLDERNVNFDEETPDVRGGNWVDVLAWRIENSDHAEKVYFSGLPGSGKTTELKRLAARLEGTKETFVVNVHALDYIIAKAATTIEASDVLIPMLHEAELAVGSRIGAQPAGVQTWLDRLRQELTGTDVFIREGKVNLQVAELTVNVQRDHNLRAMVRKAVLESPSKFSEIIRAAFEDLLNRVKTKGYLRIVVIIDSLEKIQGDNDTWPQLLSGFESLFSNGARLLDLPVHAVYTVPPALVFRTPPDTVQFMPMIKLRQSDGTVHEPGVNAGCQIVFRRILPADIDLILGPDSVKRLGKMVTWSGGYPRELVRLLRDLVVGAGLKHSKAKDIALSDSEFDEFLQRHSSAVTQQVNADEIPLLARIHATKEAQPANEAERHRLDRLLKNNIVFLYLNSRQWFDVHTAFWSLLERLKRNTPPSGGADSEPS